MMMKKTYSTPQVDIVMLAQQQPLLIGSYDGPANAPEVNFIDEDSDIFSADGGLTIGDDIVEFGE